MNSTSKILVVIPARGGSKGVPRKNIAMIGDKPLIAYTIETALAMQESFHRIIVSTDDEEIAKVSQDFGADVPFMRPAELATDEASTLSVVQHAVTFVEAQDKVKIDWVLILQPTDPLRTTEDIKKAIQMGEAGNCDSVISVVQVFAMHPIKMKKIVNDQLLPFCLEEKEGARRQDGDPPAYLRNGAIYLTRRDVLMNENSIWGKVVRPYIMPEERSVGVDTPIELELIKILLEKRSKK